MLRRGLDDRKPSSHCALGVVLVRLRIAEIGRALRRPCTWRRRPHCASIRSEQHW